MKKLNLIVLFFFLLKIISAQELNIKWSETIGGKNWDIAKTVSIGDNENLFITGEFKDSISIGDTTLISRGMNDIFIGSYTTSGKFLKSLSFGSTFNESVLLSSFQGNNLLLLIKYYHPLPINEKVIDSIQQYNYSLMWIDTSLTVTNSVALASSSDFDINNIKPINSNELLLSGSFSDNLVVGDTIIEGIGKQTFVWLINTNGDILKTKNYTPGPLGNIQSIYPLDSGKIVVSGSIVSYKKDPRAYMAIIDLNSEERQFINIGESRKFASIDIEQVEDEFWIAAKYKGNFTYGEDTIKSLGQNDILLYRINTLETEPLVNYYRVGGHGNDLPISLEVKGEYLSLTGSFVDTLWFGKEYVVSKDLGSDVFNVVFNKNMEVYSLLSFGDTNNDFPCDATVHNGELYVLGEYRDAYNGKDGSYATRGSYDIFLSKYTDCPGNNSVQLSQDILTDEAGNKSYELTVEGDYVSYEWNNGLGDNKTVSINKPGLYSVTTTNRYGCVDSATMFFAEIQKGEVNSKLTKEEDKLEPEFVEFQLYPTITNGIVNIVPGSEFEGNEITVSVYNVDGKEIKTITNNMEKTIANTFSLSDLPSGYYSIVVKDNEVVKSINVLKK